MLVTGHNCNQIQLQPSSSPVQPQTPVLYQIIIIEPTPNSTSVKLHHPSSFCFNLSHRSQRDQHHGSSLPLTLSGSTFLLQGREATETARSSFKPSRNQRDLKHHLMTRQSHDRCLKRDQSINLCSHTLWFSHLHKPNKLSLSKDSE